MAWYSQSWKYRKALTTVPSQVVATISGYVMLYSRTDLDLRFTGSGGNVGKSNSGDILFTAADGVTKIPHDIQSQNSTTGNHIIWVRVPSISATVGTVIYMYYGNAAAADQEDKAATWTDRDAVWHLIESGNGTTDEFLDSTLNGNDGTGSGGIPAQSTGKIGDCQSFDGTTDYINMGNVLTKTPSNQATWSCWINSTDTGDSSAVMSKADATGNYTGNWPLWLENDEGDLEFYLYDNAANEVSKDGVTTVNDGAWHYIVATYSGNGLQSGVSLYVDGSLLSFSGGATDTLGAYTNNFSFNIGCVDDSRYFYQGLIDEAQVRPAVIPISTIQTEYNNQNNPAAFFTVGAEESILNIKVNSRSWFVISKVSSRQASLIAKVNSRS